MQGTSAGLAGLATGLQGVQGAQQGYTGATQAGVGLGNIGAQQGQYDLAKIALQNQIANQQYNQPYQNLQFMQGMMSGLPISSQTTQGYQAPPNMLSQIGGLGTTFLGGYGLLNKSGLLDKGVNAVKNFYDSPAPQEVMFRDYGQNNLESGYQAPNVNEAEGGVIKEQRYASGGLVTLAINNALKG
jgi:hypothetical protein